MNKPLVMLLAGGGGTRLGVLVKQRAKPAVPFAGNYRIIDFALSNVMHARFDRVGVLTQYKPLSLMRHLGVGDAWNLRGRRRSVHILPPRTGEEDADWYRGTADAIWQNLEFMRNLGPERVLILSGDHIYRMDYRRMLDQHVQADADLSIAVMEVAPEEVSRFGMIWTDPQGRITRFEEKPAAADTRLASMGIYLFEWRCLIETLQRTVATRQGFDFGFDIMAQLLASRRVMAHRFAGYWRDVGTIASYYQANMDTLDPASGFDLDRWEICTRDDDGPEGDRPPSRLGPGADCRRSMISSACQIDGRVVDSVLSPGVRIETGARVEGSILLDGVRIGRSAVVRRAVIDKHAQIGPGTLIDGGRDEVANARYAICQLMGLSVIGKSVQVPGGLRVGSNVVIEAGTTEAGFSGDLPDGATLAGTQS